MPKYGGKQNFSFVSFPEVGRKKTESESRWLQWSVPVAWTKKEKSKWKQWPASLLSATTGCARKPPGPKDKMIYFLYSFYLCQSMRGNIISASGVSPKWVKCRRRKIKKSVKNGQLRFRPPPQVEHASCLDHGQICFYGSRLDQNQLQVV